MDWLLSQFMLLACATSLRSSCVCSRRTFFVAVARATVRPPKAQRQSQTVRNHNLEGMGVAKQLGTRQLGGKQDAQLTQKEGRATRGQIKATRSGVEC